MTDEMRRGASSLAALVPTIQQDLRDGREQDALRLLFGFADDFRGSGREGQEYLIRDEPPPTGDRRFDAALAAVAEFFAGEADFPPPAWVNGPARFAVPWYFAASMTALHAYVLAHTPIVFARHGVFMAREVWDRA